MNDYPTEIEINGRRYKIRTDFRVAIQCEELARDTSISDYERPMAIVFTLFEDLDVRDEKELETALKLAKKYLSCNKEPKDGESKEPDMSFIQDWSYIEASFMSDYHIDLSKEEMHWWKFFDLMNGLTEKCVLNRIRYVRTFDISEIKNPKDRNKWLQMKKEVELKREKTLEEKEADDLFERQMRGDA